MANNISKYVQLTDFLLLEYEFNKDGVNTDLTDIGITPVLATNAYGVKQYFNKPDNYPTKGTTNNSLILNSQPLNNARSEWYINPSDTNSYYQYFDTSTYIAQDKYPHDKVKVHIVSGYNFDDISGFLLQIRAKDVSGNLVNLSNFTWIKQVLGNDVIKFSPNSLYLGNRFYDKYTELLVPSVQELGGSTSEPIESALNIEQLSDVYVTYSTIPEINNDNYIVNELIALQLPVTSVADNFNAFISESTSGDFIEFYGTWRNQIIGDYIGDIESGRIKLYTSNNPNDNYQEFADQYGEETAKWVLMHEIYVYEHIPAGTDITSLLTQKFSFTQEDNFTFPNYFRPVIKNSDIASSFTIEYICRLMNRMDGSQIIRKASFASSDPKKYGRYFDRINVDNYIPYKVFNRIIPEKPNVVVQKSASKTKFVKVYYDSTNVALNQSNEILPQGTGPLFLKRNDSVYDFRFEKLNTSTEEAQKENVDLSGVFNYSLKFVLDDESIIEVPPTYSKNMNTALGELEFKLEKQQALDLLKQNNNSYSIVVKNPDGSEYTFYEGVYYAYTDFDQVITQYKSLFDITALNTRIAELEAENTQLLNENNALKAQ